MSQSPNNRFLCLEDLKSNFESSTELGPCLCDMPFCRTGIMVIYGCHEAVHGLGRREDGTTSPPASINPPSISSSSRLSLLRCTVYLVILKSKPVSWVSIGTGSFDETESPSARTMQSDGPRWYHRRLNTFIVDTLDPIKHLIVSC